MTVQRQGPEQQRSPLRSERGITRIENLVVAKVTGIAAREMPFGSR
jgi:hypothetical protein